MTREMQSLSLGIPLYRMMWMLCTSCDWSLPMIYQSACRYMDDVTGKLFSLFCLTWAQIWKCVWDYFKLEGGSKEKKFPRRLTYKEDKWRNGGKESSWPSWECLNCKKSFHHVSSVQKTRCCAKCFRTLFCFELEKTLKNSSKKLYTSKIHY